MEKLRVNDTPVRTARNFLINNIEIELEMPEKIAEFKNVEIINNGSIIDNQTTNQALTYGTGKILEELNYETANNKIRIQTGSKKENIRIRYNFDDNSLPLGLTMSKKSLNSHSILFAFSSSSMYLAHELCPPPVLHDKINTFI